MAMYYTMIAVWDFIMYVLPTSDVTSLFLLAGSCDGASVTSTSILLASMLKPLAEFLLSEQNFTWSPLNENGERMDAECVPLPQSVISFFPIVILTLSGHSQPGP